ncbi:hypothetical protein BGW80DRAFT_445352 [Lactifluus volemus]|nr:hypothetical protein BGW80DRAFT_445352 [Lactifluus volemus]
MPGCCSTIIYPPLIRRLGRRKQFQIMTFVSLICSDLIGSNSNRRHSPIDILNDDVLLHIFHLYRLVDPDECEYKNGTLHFTRDDQHWWYKLTHVCRLWRNIILESPSRLNLHLCCANGVPVADMLAHSPPLPLTIYYTGWKVAAKDESDILLALSHRDRVHHVYFSMARNMGKFVTAMNDQFPILERMYILSLTEVVLPFTFRAPNLRHLQLSTASIPIQSSLLLTTTAAGLVSLSLLHISASVYFPPSEILTRLSLMAQLERLSITFFYSPMPNHDVLHQTPNMTTLPSLRRFLFRGAATYLEGLVACISAPSLSILRVNLFDQLPLTVPRLCQFMQSSEDLTFRAVQVTFGISAVSLHVVPWKWDTPLMLQIMCGRIDWQVASAVQLFGTLSPVLSLIEKVAFSYDEHHQSEWLDNVDQRQWRELLRPFTNVKTIHMKDGLISKIFPSLACDDGDPLLPNAEEVGYSGGIDARDALTTFFNERQVSGHPVSLQRVYRWTFDIPWNL